MTWLFLDTSVSGSSRIGHISEQGVSVKTLNGRSDVVVRELIKAIPTPSSSPFERGRMNGVIVVSGPGSFSAIRAGVVCANLIARLRRVPLVGVTVDEAKDLDTLLDRIASKQLRSQKTVLPTYNAEPNITMPRV